MAQGIPERQHQQQQADHAGEPLGHMEMVLTQQDAPQHHQPQGADGVVGAVL